MLAACPKCGTDSARVSRGACAQCGLRVDLWDTFDGSVPADAFLDPAFATLVGSWADPAAHETFINLAQRAELLDAAAARYKRVTRSRPDDEPARQALTRIALIVAHAPQVAPQITDGSLKLVRAISTVLALAIALFTGVVLYRVFRG